MRTKHPQQTHLLKFGDIKHKAKIVRLGRKKNELLTKGRNHVGISIADVRFPQQGLRASDKPGLRP